MIFLSLVSCLLFYFPALLFDPIFCFIYILCFNSRLLVEPSEMEASGIYLLAYFRLHWIWCRMHYRRKHQKCFMQHHSRRHMAPYWQLYEINQSKKFIWRIVMNYDIFLRQILYVYVIYYHLSFIQDGQENPSRTVVFDIQPATRPSSTGKVIIFTWCRCLKPWVVHKYNTLIVLV